MKKKKKKEMLKLHVYTVKSRKQRGLKKKN